METGLVAMVDNVLTTDEGQVSVLDLQACQQLLTKLVMWFLLAHLCILIGTAKSHSAQPPLFGEAPGKSVAGGWAALRTMLTLTSLWLFSWVKCGDGISEVALSIGANPGHCCPVPDPQHHTTRATTKDLCQNDVEEGAHNTYY